MERRRLGRTGHQSSIAIFGAAALAQASAEDASIGLLQCLAAGVNHVDVAPQYGRAQSLLGPLLPAHRHRLFVAAKSLRRNPDGVAAQLEETLHLLRCDQLDLYQLHGVTSVEDLDERGRAAEVLLAARSDGRTRFIGVTGHGLEAPRAQLEALRRYDLDTVMFPVNPRLWAEPQYRHDAEELLELATARDVGVMAIKAVAARPWGDRPHTATTWYEPFTEEALVARGIDFALSVPGVHAVCTPGDLSVLPSALAAAEAHQVMGAPAFDAASAAVADEPLIFPMPVA